MASFRICDRVRLSELGKKRAPKARACTGEVVKIPSGGQSVEVLFDRNTCPTRIHRSYIELDDSDEVAHQASFKPDSQ
jgi:hypothetical protein